MIHQVAAVALPIHMRGQRKAYFILFWIFRAAVLVGQVQYRTVQLNVHNNLLTPFHSIPRFLCSALGKEHLKKKKVEIRMEQTK